jgi:signal transduction histidine kinase
VTDETGVVLSGPDGAGLAPRARGRGRLRVRMGLLVGAGTIVPIAIVAWAGASAVSDLQAQLGAERQALASALAARLDDEVEHTLVTLGAIPSSPRFDASDCDSGRAGMHQARLRHRYLEGVAVTDSRGAIRCEEPSGCGGSVLPGLPAVTEALTTGRPGASGLLRGPPPVIILLAPFRDWQGHVAGTMVGRIDPASPAWAELLGPRGGGSGAWVELVDADGAILASTTTARRSPNPAGPLAAAAPLSSTSWHVIVRRPEEESLLPVRRFRQRLLFLGPLLVASALVLARGAVRSLTGPLAALGRAASRIASGDLAHPVPAGTADEVGALGRSLESMRAALSASLDAVHRERDALEVRVKERTRELEALYRTLREREERRGQLLRQTISAQEDERKRIARELHDETCQALAALALSFHRAASAEGPEEVGRHLEVAKALATRTLEDVHRLILALRPSVLDDLGLLPALRWFAARHLETQGIAVRWEVEGLEGRLRPEIEIALFRAVQEALTNVARHAEADAVLIQIARREGTLQIEIEDDGKGFDPASVADPVHSERGLGLLGIRERLELLGGQAEIDSSPGEGTRVVLRVPVEASVPVEAAAHV